MTPSQKTRKKPSLNPQKTQKTLLKLSKNPQENQREISFLKNIKKRRDTTVKYYFFFKRNWKSIIFKALPISF
jgi:hypothetical protein